MFTKRHLISLIRLIAQALLCGAALAPALAHAADEMRTGCSGGFTGGGSGLVLSADGGLWNWTQSTAGAAIERGPLLGADVNTASRLFAQAASGRFNKLDFRQVGNMTCWIELTVKGVRHEVSWPDRKSAPALALNLYDEVQELHVRLTKNQLKP